MVLCLYNAAGEETQRVAMKRSENVFHAFVAGVVEGQQYGFRAQGDYSPAEGKHFDPQKLLLDPYAQAITGSFQYTAALSRHGTDSAILVPKGVVAAPQPDLPVRAVPDPQLIYELNVRGFTMRHPDVPKGKRGTIAALAEPAVIAHFKKIGVDCIELMPIAAWIDERHLVNLGLRNAWGYNPVSFFAIEPKLAPGGLTELRDTVSTLHAHGISVILDVVFNHTGESDALGPTLSLRGLDNAAYYRLFHGGYVNDAGTGNTLALDRPHTVQLVVDALRHFVLQAGVDGFRFDLATVMGRTETGFKADAPLLKAINSDPVLSTRILIAEPWDIGPGGYQLGNFPPNWFEWNDKYRDDVRRFWRGDSWSANALATRLAGSSDVFSRKGKPSRSVNFIAAHDGFTLHDLLNFTQKDNLANGEGNRDGKTDEVTCTPANAKALLATLLLSRGTPMLTAGDEFGRTQNGNNNAYAQDNDTSWLQWDTANGDLIDHFAKLVELRHVLRDVIGDAFLSESTVTWLDETGAQFNWSTADNRILLMVLRAKANRVCIAVNGSDQAFAFPLRAEKKRAWSPLLGEGFSIPAQSVSVFRET
jgi:glycogen debranching enzyme